MKGPQPIAIVGIGGIFPDAQNPNQLWQNIINKKSAAREVDSSRWTLGVEQAYQEGRPAPDKVYSKKACLISNFSFDPHGYHIPEDVLTGLDPACHYGLEACRQAWMDCNNETINRDRVAVIIGNIALPTEKSSQLADWVYSRKILQQLGAKLGTSFNTNNLKPVHALNRYVMGLPATIIAQAFGFGGTHLALDAACSSALFALKMSVDELQNNHVDAVVTGGLCRPDPLFTQMGFSQLTALSPSGHCAPFDEKGDGLVVGEGAGMLVLKRLSDARRDGDTIYALIRAIGVSNDTDGNLLAPSKEGQLRAMHAAYQQADLQPNQVDFIECHATGTPIGDAVEFNSLVSLWDEQPVQQKCVLGAVKENTGHLLTGAGAVGLIKALCALQSKTLPPMAHYTTPNANIDLDNSPFEFLSEPKEWPRRTEDTPRRCAISGFGFGGTNAHVILEEYLPKKIPEIQIDSCTEDIAIVAVEEFVGDISDHAAYEKIVMGLSDKKLPNISPYNQLNSHGTYFSTYSIPLGKFKIPPNELKEILPQQAIMLDVAAKAIEQCNFENVDKGKTGVYIGLGLDLNTTNYHLRWQLKQQLTTWWQRHSTLSKQEFEEWLLEILDIVHPPLNANRTVGGLGSIVASRIAREFSIGGPSYTLSNEDGSGLLALQAAIQAIQSKNIECAIVGAIELTQDLRALLCNEIIFPGNINQQPEPFVQSNSGTMFGDGAVAFVLKPLSKAKQDQDSILSVVKGISCNTGNAHVKQWDKLVLERTLQDSLKQANVGIEHISLIDSSSTGLADEDVLHTTFVNEKFIRNSKMTDVKRHIGHHGAASVLFQVSQLCRALYSKTYPDTYDIKRKRLVPSQHWLRNKAQGKRYALAQVATRTGCYGHIVLEEGETFQPIRSNLPMEMFVIEAHDKSSLQSLLSKLQELNEQSEATLTDIMQQWQSIGHHADAELGIVLLAKSKKQLRKNIAAVHEFLDTGKELPPDQTVFCELQPKYKQSKMAFVYPGSGSHYQHMGQALSTVVPQVLELQDENNTLLKEQYIADKLWNEQTQLSTADLIQAQVTFGSLMTDILQYLGVQPQASIGYSLGETTSYISLRVWKQRDELLKRLQTSPLFQNQLVPDYQVLRQYLNIPKEQAIEWVVGVIPAPRNDIQSTLQEHSVFALITNTPNETVVGGLKADVEQCVQALDLDFISLEGVATVHNQAVKLVKQDYLDFHTFETSPVENIMFYSCASSEKIDISTQNCAESITQQAVHGFDFVDVIHNAYNDGVRIFLEIGPGNACSRMIRENVPGDALIISANNGHDEILTLQQCLAQLITQRIPVDYTKLFSGDEPSPVDTKPVITISLPALTLDPMPALDEDSHENIVQESQVSSTESKYIPITIKPEVFNISMRDIFQQRTYAEQLANMATTNAKTHKQFLSVSRQLEHAALEQAQWLQQVSVGSMSNSGSDLAIVQAKTTLSDEPVFYKNNQKIIQEKLPVFLNRDQCLEYAIGSIGNVLGDDFASVDNFPSRVRLPDEPLMLVDRIVSVDAEPLSMSQGTLVTEHDIHPQAWYLDANHIATCIAIEAGQADLFLSGYLGIDHQTKGLAFYRLLDAAVTFYDELPVPGSVIRYVIQIEHFFRQGDTWLFRFHFDAFVGDTMLMQMRDGCAGFFTKKALDAGQGIVRSALAKRQNKGDITNFKPLVDMKIERYSAEQLAALRQGDITSIFGPQFAQLAIKKPLTIPDGLMNLVHRVDTLDPHGGWYGIGLISAQADIHPDDWFLVCHFCDDQVMPGTLMYECCLHTFRIYVMRMGWIGEEDQVVYQPVPGINSRLKCRGQVTATTNVVTYEIHIKKIGYNPEPYAIADAMMYADNKAIVEITDMSMRLSNTDQKQIESLWHHENDTNSKNSSIFTRSQLEEFAVGYPSKAFGKPYEIFDEQRVMARLPKPPFLCIDHVIQTTAIPFQLQANTECTTIFAIDSMKQFFSDNNQKQIPYSILLEMALQPCGWLAAYSGTALLSENDLHFRNLGGKARLHKPVTMSTKTIQTKAVLSQVSKTGDMIIVHYSFEQVDERNEIVFSGKTYFGFFTDMALQEQKGLTEPELYAVTMKQPYAPEIVPTTKPFASGCMRMIDKIQWIDEGGPQGLGLVQGSINVDPGAWFFDAHFYQDPVWPGSLGLEGFIQVLKYAVMKKYNLPSSVQFSTLPLGDEHEWIYRGQITPANKQVEIVAWITKLDKKLQKLYADGYLVVDGLPIYAMKNFSVEYSL